MGIVVDQQKCHKDGLCALDCPIGIITMDGPDGLPAPVEGFDELCIDCGHCVAVCPHEALSQGGITPRQCLPLDAPGLSPEQLAQLLKGRRSIRRYKDQPLEQSTIAPPAGHGPLRPQRPQRAAGEVAGDLGPGQAHALGGHRGRLDALRDKRGARGRRDHAPGPRGGGVGLG